MKDHENCFRWPINDDTSDYECEYVICKIEAPEITGASAKNKRKDLYSVAPSNWEEACTFIDDN